MVEPQTDLVAKTQRGAGRAAIPAFDFYMLAAKGREQELPAAVVSATRWRLRNSAAVN